MKIVHYINNLDPGNAEKLLSEILLLIKAKEHNVHLAYSNNKLNVKNYDETCFWHCSFNGKFDLDTSQQSKYFD